MAWAFPGASGDAHGGEGRREGYVGSRKPLQEGAAHCGGGAIAGGGSTRVSVNAKIQFEKKKPLHAAVCLGGTRYQQQGGDWREEATLIAQPAYGWTP